MKLDFSFEAMFSLLKLYDYDIRFASCIMFHWECLHSMPLIGVIYSLFKIKWNIDQNGLDLYPKIKQSCVSAGLLIKGLEQAIFCRRR